MGDGDVQRDLGRLDAQVESLTRLVAAMTTKQDAMNATLTEMNQTISEAKGGWKVFVMFGTASAVIGGIIVKIFPWFSMSGKG